MSDPADNPLSNGRLRLLIQILGFAFFAGVAWWRISVLETAVSRLDVKIEETRATTAQTSIAIARLEERDRIAAVLKMLLDEGRAGKRRQPSGWYPSP